MMSRCGCFQHLGGSLIIPALPRQCKPHSNNRQVPRYLAARASRTMRRTASNVLPSAADRRQ